MSTETARWTRSGNVFTFTNGDTIPLEIVQAVPAGVDAELYLDQVLGALNDDKERFVQFSKPRPPDPEPPQQPGDEQPMRLDQCKVCLGQSRADKPCSGCSYPRPDGVVESHGVTRTPVPTWDDRVKR